MQWHGPYHATVGRGFQPRRPCRQEDGAPGVRSLPRVGRARIPAAPTCRQEDGAPGVRSLPRVGRARIPAAPPAKRTNQFDAEAFAFVVPTSPHVFVPPMPCQVFVEDGLNGGSNGEMPVGGVLTRQAASERFVELSVSMGGETRHESGRPCGGLRASAEKSRGPNGKVPWANEKVA